MRLFTILLDLASRISTGENWIQIGPFLLQWGAIAVTTQKSENEGQWIARYQLTFLRTFSSGPYIFLTDNIGGDYQSSNAPTSATTSGTLIKHIDTRPATTNVAIYWLAIGRA